MDILHFNRVESLELLVFLLNGVDFGIGIERPELGFLQGLNFDLSLVVLFLQLFLLFFPLDEEDQSENHQQDNDD